MPSELRGAADWVHLKALRVVVESMLRYGLRVKNYSFIVFVGVGEAWDVAEGEDGGKDVRGAGGVGEEREWDVDCSRRWEAT